MAPEPGVHLAAGPFSTSVTTRLREHMQFSFSGEIMSDVGDDYAAVRSQVEVRLQQRLVRTPYGEGVKEFFFAGIVLPFEMYPEVKKYDRNDRSMEFRLIIDHRSFKAGSRPEQFKLFFAALLRCLEHMKDMSIPDFDRERLERDMLAIGADSGWVDSPA